MFQFETCNYPLVVNYYSRLNVSHQFDRRTLMCIISWGSPHHHQLKGLAEKYVQLVTKSKEVGGNHHFAIITYRNTPIGNSLETPTELLYCKAAKSDLPVSYAGRLKEVQTSHHQGEAVHPTTKTTKKH